MSYATVHVYCDHPQHRRWEVTSFTRRRIGSPSIARRRYSDHNGPREWAWYENAHPSSAYVLEARRKREADDARNPERARGRDLILQHAREREGAEYPDGKRPGFMGMSTDRRAMGDQTVFRVADDGGARTMPTTGREYFCTKCERKAAQGRGSTSQRLRVREVRLFDLLDAVAAAGAREVSLRELIRLNSTY